MPGVRFPDHAVQLRSGDRLVLYTDGITEAFNAADEAYGTQRLIDEIRVYGAGAAAALIERICCSVTAFCRHRPAVRRHHLHRAELGFEPNAMPAAP